MKKIIFALVLTSFNLSIGYAQDQLQVGDTAPDIQGETIEGKKFSLAKSMAKGEIVVLNFWFSSCRPCMEEIKHLRKLQETHKKNPKVRFIGICIESPINAKDFKKFVQSKGFTYEHITYARKIARNYKVELFPTNIIIKNGKIAYYSVGYQENIHQSLADIVKNP